LQLAGIASPAEKRRASSQQSSATRVTFDHHSRENNFPSRLLVLIPIITMIIIVIIISTYHWPLRVRSELLINWYSLVDIICAHKYTTKVHCSFVCFYDRLAMLLYTHGTTLDLHVPRYMCVNVYLYNRTRGQRSRQRFQRVR